MYVLRIEYPVPDYEAWKAAFDADALDREGSGVRRYRLMRPTGETNNDVAIDLEFEDPGRAEAYLAALRDLYDRATVVQAEPRALIVEVLESREY